MKNVRRMACLTLAAAVAVASGCGGESGSESESADAAIKTPAELADEAQQTINHDNAQAELDRLENEIRSEEP